MEKVTITAKKLKPFKGDDGESVPYVWYKAERATDQTTFQFGSTHTEYEIGDEIETIFEKRQNSKGKPYYVEITTE